MILEFAAVAAGGALGSVLRALMMVHISTWLKPNFPVALLAINWLGCLLIGFLASLMVRGNWGGVARSFWIIGLCGGFTTFSSFALDSCQLFLEHRQYSALLNAALQVFGCIGFTALGLVLGR